MWKTKNWKRGKRPGIEDGNDQLKSENEDFERKNKTLQLELIDSKEEENRVKTRFQQLMGDINQAMIMAKKDQ